MGAIDRRLARRKALPASTTADEVDDFAKALAAAPV